MEQCKVSSKRSQDCSTVIFSFAYFLSLVGNDKPLEGKLGTRLCLQGRMKGAATAANAAPQNGSH